MFVHGKLLRNVLRYQSDLWIHQGRVPIVQQEEEEKAEHQLVLWGLLKVRGLRYRITDLLARIETFAIVSLPLMHSLLPVLEMLSMIGDCLPESVFTKSGKY